MDATTRDLVLVEVARLLQRQGIPLEAFYHALGIEDGEFQLGLYTDATAAITGLLTAWQNPPEGAGKISLSPLCGHFP